VIELHLIVLEVFATVLAGIVIAANNTHLDSEWNVAASPSALCCLGESLRRKYYRTDVAKYCAPHIGNYSWNTLRVAFGIERPDLLLEYLPPCGVDRATVRELSGSQTLLQIFVMQYCLFTRTRQQRGLLNQRTVRAVPKFPAWLAYTSRNESPMLQNLLIRLVLSITEQTLDFRVKCYSFLSAHDLGFTVPPDGNRFGTAPQRHLANIFQMAMHGACDRF